MRFETTLALRHLRSGGGQTVLTVSAVAAGVVVIIFISSLIFGLRQQTTEILTDILPHITVTVPDQEALPSLSTSPIDPGAIISRKLQPPAQQLKLIENWPQMLETIRRLDRVAAAAPTVSGQGFVSRGEQRLGAAVIGARPEELNEINSVTKYVFAGHYLGLQSDEIVISHRLAQDLGVGLGDRVRLTSPLGLSDSFTVAGLYDTGREQRLGSRVYITLRTAQALYGTGTAAESILVRCRDLFDADHVADQIAVLLRLRADSWSRENPEIVSSLNAQSAVTLLVSGFSLLASGFAIASVLIVSVLQRSREIGILKGIGAKPAQILRAYLLEGLGIGVVGALLGALLGCGVVLLLTQFKQPAIRIGAPPQPLFPAQLALPLIGSAVLSAVFATVIAAALPARRAAALDPVEVIR